MTDWEARAVAAETALAEANTDAVQLGARLVAAERRANDLADALRHIDSELAPLYAGANSFGAHLQSAKLVARAALDRQEQR